MNRSVLSEVLHSTTLHVAPGALAVARSFRHPTRGMVDCPAHHLLAAHARRAGLVADSLSLSDTDLGDALPEAPTTVFTVSYEKPEGGHRGLALAVRSNDPAAIAFARRQIESWQPVLRTRRVLYVVAPTVGGTADGPRTAGHPVPSQTTDGPRSPWQPCGCPAGASCPATGNAQRALRRFLDRGAEVVVVGAPVAGTGTWPAQALGASAVLVRTPQEAELLTVTDPDRLAFAVTPGAAVSEVAEILHVLRRRCPRLRGQHPREWCYTMDDLRTVVASALTQSDTLLVTGEESAPAVRTAITQAARAGVRVRDVTELANLRPDDIDGATITLLDATPDGRGRREVGQALNGLGPASHVRREVRSYPEPSHDAAQSIAAR
ncbi:4-hydroxy-3-methylbut-2-enyl diphosphate reductase [Streptomyces sp. SID12501]|uniref:4-hydroxy-3-methylbut-2-enyl diphosphate reductase n=1 Tax=Streptomyces sp. SID12501 TaxID=2706042 RepID=A0A6B3BU92_9ACTN|nr:4-hydroxy-3-methylbut-2-enyl diphosphate reductase [Streptomyces sp. SID12501]NEC87826.1 4-hydroxy-3-methylbut-2-enyl diphosphate reductase [Streptomyces sp. SID12501]